MMAMATKYEYTGSLDELLRKVTLFACLLCISKTLVMATTVDTAPAVVTSATDTSLDSAAVPLVSAPVANRKRISLRSIDPLTRRSAVDKHFIRFGRNEHDAGGGDRIPHKSINLQKREIFQSNLDDHSERARAFRDRNSNSITSLTWSLPVPSAIPADCFSSLAIFANRTCLNRLRIRHRQIIPKIQLEPQHSDHFSGHSVNSDYIVVVDDDDKSENYDNHFATAKNEYDGNDENADANVVDDDDNESDTGNNNHDFYDKKDKSTKNSPASNNESNADLLDGAPIAGRATPPSAYCLLRQMWPKADLKSGSLAKAVTNSDAFVRMTRNKFSRNLFSRYDRGRDNFMRLGRAHSRLINQDGRNSDAISGQNTPTLDNADDAEGEYVSQLRPGNENEDEEDERHRITGFRMKRSVNEKIPVERFKRKHDSFMRLGRKHDANFMRLGRTEARSSFIRYGRNERIASANSDYDRWTRKHDNFMRLGRNHHHLHPQMKREKAQNFMRLGRRDRNDYIVAPLHEAFHLEPVSTMTLQRPPRSDNFVRFGRGKSDSSDSRTEWNFQLEHDLADNIEDDDNLERDDDTSSSVLKLAVPRFRRDVTSYQSQHHHHHHYQRHLNDTRFSPTSHSANSSYQFDANDSSSSSRDRRAVESLERNDDGDANAVLVKTPVQVPSSSITLSSPTPGHPFFVSLSKEWSPPSTWSSHLLKQRVTSLPSLVATIVPHPFPIPFPVPLSQR